MRILVIGGLPKSLINFRGPLLRALVLAGHSVWASANGDNPEVAQKLKKMGVSYCPIRLNRAGMNPFVDFMTWLEIVHLVGRIDPQVVLSYTIKPVVYGGLAAAFCKIASIYSMIEGLGYAFMEANFLSHRLTRFIATVLYKIALRNNRRVFFLNPDDQELFLDLKIAHQSQVSLINGTGVDLDHFSVAPSPPKDKFGFLLIARLLRDKGIVEFVEATRRVKSKYPQTKFFLVGDLDPNPACVTQGELTGWVKEGIIEYLGYRKDVRPAIAESSVFVLPSYREGMPRTVLEAMAMGRPIITTDAPGCRETITRNGNVCSSHMKTGVIEGENGFLVPVKNAEKLAEAMEQFILNPELISRMGARSRQVAVEKYDVHKVNAIILKAMGLA
jgi:glycosyltransferase involved in cell wall biosynthesis